MIKSNTMTINLDENLTSILDNKLLAALDEIGSQRFATNHDSLVLSCAWYRLRNSNIMHSVNGMDADELLNYITKFDIQSAEKIAKYYTEKLILIKLKNENISKFKKDLIEYLISDRMGFTNNNYGMIYRLPEFYHYDISLDKLFEQHFSNIFSNNTVINKKDNVSIKPLLRLQKASPRGIKNDYWCKELNNNMPILIKIERRNELLSLWDNIFNNNKKLELFGKITTTNRNGYKYLELSHWVLSSNAIITQKD